MLVCPHILALVYVHWLVILFQRMLEICEFQKIAIMTTPLSYDNKFGFWEKEDFMSVCFLILIIEVEL